MMGKGYFGNIIVRSGGRNDGETRVDCHFFFLGIPSAEAALRDNRKGKDSLRSFWFSVDIN